MTKANSGTVVDCAKYYAVRRVAWRANGVCRHCREAWPNAMGRRLQALQGSFQLFWLFCQHVRQNLVIALRHHRSSALAITISCKQFGWQLPDMSRAAKESLPCTLWSQGVHAVRVALSSDLPAMPGNLHPVYEGVRLIHTARTRKKTTQATSHDEASVWKKHVAYTILHAICNHSCLYNCEIHICIAALGCRKRRSFSQSSDITSDLAYTY